MKSHSFAVLLGVTLSFATAASAAPPGFTPKPPAGPGNPVGAPPMSWNQWVTMFRDYVDLIDHFAQVSKDPSSAGVAAVIYADEILRTKPAREAIDYYVKLLPDVKDPAVQRAIHLRLAEHYRLSNQPDEALGQLRGLMTAPAPAPNATK
jgi:hypothetical protein